MAKIKQATKHTGRARKEQIVARLIDKFDSSNSLVFADYQGLTNKQIEDLKKELKKLDASFLVAKNTLLKLALDKSKNFKEIKDNEGLNMPTAILLIKADMVEPLKIVQKAIKNFGLPKIKFGVLEGLLTDEAGVLKIASLPNRETLLTQLVGTLNSPISGLVFTLNANIQKFVITLDAVVKSKPQTAEPVQKAPTQPPALQGETLEGQSSKSEDSNQPPVAETSEPDQTTTQVEQPEPISEQTAEETKSEAQNSNSETNSNDQSTNGDTSAASN